VYSVVFTPLATGDLRRIVVDLHRRWGTVWGNDLSCTRVFVRDSLIAPLETNPFSEFSRELSHHTVRNWSIDKGLYFGTYHVGYIVRQDEKKCIVFLIQANGTFDDFLNKAILRARDAGAILRE
jgi:hypothetical protein